MTLCTILIHPDPRLKKTAAPITGITSEVERLAADMLETMYAAPGIGLAAPQVGVMSRLFVMDCVKEEGEPPRPIVLLNPELCGVQKIQIPMRRDAFPSLNSMVM